MNSNTQLFLINKSLKITLVL